MEELFKTREHIVIDVIRLNVTINIVSKRIPVYLDPFLDFQTKPILVPSFYGISKQAINTNLIR